VLGFLHAPPAPPAHAGCPARQLVQEVAWLAPNVYMLNVRCGWLDRFTGYCMAVRWSCLNLVSTRARHCVFNTPHNEDAALSPCNTMRFICISIC